MPQRGLHAVLRLLLGILPVVPKSSADLDAEKAGHVTDVSAGLLQNPGVVVPEEVDVPIEPALVPDEIADPLGERLLGNGASLAANEDEALIRPVFEQDRAIVPEKELVEFEHLALELQRDLFSVLVGGKFEPAPSLTTRRRNGDAKAEGGKIVQPKRFAKLHAHGERRLELLCLLLRRDAALADTLLLALAHHSARRRREAHHSGVVLRWRQPFLVLGG